MDFGRNLSEEDGRRDASSAVASMKPLTLGQDDQSDMRCYGAGGCQKWLAYNDMSVGSSCSNVLLNDLSVSSVSTRASTKDAPNPPQRASHLSKIFDSVTLGDDAAPMAQQEAKRASAVAAERETEVLAFVEAGPLFGKLQPRRSVPAAEWLRLASLVVAELTGTKEEAEALPSALDGDTAARVYHLYLPMYLWMRAHLRETAAARAKRGDVARRALAVGLSAPQGCGKTTVVTVLERLFAADGLACAHVSMDDFYLTGATQDAVAARHPENAILQVRGNAGTHDIALGEATLRALLTDELGEVAVPVYDKAARGGRGDRAPTDRWRMTQTPCDIVLFEGWMFGFKPRGGSAEADLAAVHPALPEINAMLSKYSVWDDLMDAWCVFGLDDKTHVFKWRLEAERQMANAGRPGMSDEQVKDFVARYMPAYTAYCPRLYADAGEGGVDGKPTLLIRVDGSRKPIG